VLQRHFLYTLQVKLFIVPWGFKRTNFGISYEYTRLPIHNMEEIIQILTIVLMLIALMEIQCILSIY
jgi:hypothetical protein